MADERIDRDLLLGELAAVRFAEETLRSDAWTRSSGSTCSASGCSR